MHQPHPQMRRNENLTLHVLGDEGEDIQVTVEKQSIYKILGIDI